MFISFASSPEYFYVSISIVYVYIAKTTNVLSTPSYLIRLNCCWFSCLVETKPEKKYNDGRGEIGWAESQLVIPSELARLGILFALCFFFK